MADKEKAPGDVRGLGLTQTAYWSGALYMGQCIAPLLRRDVSIRHMLNASLRHRCCGAGPAKYVLILP